MKASSKMTTKKGKENFISRTAKDLMPISETTKLMVKEFFIEHREKELRASGEKTL